MTREHFAEVTGFIPTLDEWQDILDKAKLSGSAEDYIEIFQNHNEAQTYYENRAETIRELQKEIAEIRIALDIELNWVLTTKYGTHLSLPQIQKIDEINIKSLWVLDDTAAAKYLADNFGYDINRLSFPHIVNRYQVNKYCQYRLRSVTRMANVNHSSIQYIRFDVLAGEDKTRKVPYELINGTIYPLNEVPAHSDAKRY